MRARPHSLPHARPLEERPHEHRDHRQPTGRAPRHPLAPRDVTCRHRAARLPEAAATNAHRRTSQSDAEAPILASEIVAWALPARRRDLARSLPPQPYRSSSAAGIGWLLRLAGGGSDALARMNSHVLCRGMQVAAAVDQRQRHRVSPALSVAVLDALEGVVPVEEHRL